jgi:SAM-dependent methyltransferase
MGRFAGGRCARLGFGWLGSARLGAGSWWCDRRRGRGYLSRYACARDPVHKAIAYIACRQASTLCQRLHNPSVREDGPVPTEDRVPTEDLTKDAASRTDRIDRIARTRAFFGPRAAGWEDRFPDDGPAFSQAVAELAPPPGGVVLDVACGTGRAIPALRQAVGAAGTVIALDLTVEMVIEARRHGGSAALLVADAVALPIATGALDAVFAAGLLPHLGDPAAGLDELARVCRHDARLALFHPIGRAPLARRHGHELDPADIRNEPLLRRALADAGWTLERCEDGEDRYLALAVRR